MDTNICAVDFALLGRVKKMQFYNPVYFHFSSPVLMVERWTLTVCLMPELEADLLYTVISEDIRSLFRFRAPPLDP